MSAATFVLGVEIARTGLHLVLLGADGQVAFRLRRAYGSDGESTADAAGWWRGMRTGLKDLLRRAGVDAVRVRAIGLCDEPGLYATLRPDGTPGATMIAGSDPAGDAAALAELVAAAGVRNLANLTARAPRADALATQLLRLRASDKRGWHDLAVATTARGFLLSRLAGKAATDAGSAAASLLWSPRGKAWSKQVAGILGIDAAVLPPVLGATAAGGRLSPAAARESGLPAGIPVTVGAGHAAALHQLAGLPPALVELGGIGAVVVTGAAPAPLEPTVLSDGTPGSEGLGFAAEDLPVWCLNHLLPAEAAQVRRSGREPFEALADCASSSAPGANGVGCAIAGGRTAFTGIEPARHLPGDLVRAAFEGCAAAAAAAVPGDGPLAVAGPGAAVPLWCQLLADAAGRPVQAVVEPMPAALAAALAAADLAGMGKGVAALRKRLDHRLAYQPRKAAQEAIRAVRSAAATTA